MYSVPPETTMLPFEFPEPNGSPFGPRPPNWPSRPPLVPLSQLFFYILSDDIYVLILQRQYYLVANP